MKRSIIFGFISLFTLGSCAVDRKINLSKIDLDPGYSSISPLLLVVQDKRDPILTNKQKQSWCGRVNIYNIQTDNRKAVSSDLATIICYGIAKTGAKVEKIVLAPKADFNSVLEEFPFRPEKRLLFITIKNWETNCRSLLGSMRYEVISTFELKVYDQSGKLVANEEVGDSKIKEQGAGVNMQVLQHLTEETLQEQIRKIFSKSTIKSSLQVVPLAQHQ